MRNGPTKIILINAGKYEYAEVGLDGAVQIVGPNNSGKTTLISTLQFLYIDDSSKMVFRGHTLDETFDYFLHSEHSYVLFECRTLRGSVVVGWRGASRASGADAERFFYLGPFRREDFLADDRIRPPKEISASLADRDFQFINKAAEHRTLLLSGANQRNSGLGIVALKDGERFSDFRDTLKNLLCLANITQEQMRERLLMLAGLSTDYIAIDARRVLGQDYEDMKRELDELRQLQKHQKEVQAIVELFNERQVLRGQLNYRWRDLKARKETFDKGHKAQVAVLDEKIEAARGAATTSKTALGLKRKERDGFLTEKSPMDVQLKTLEANKKTYNAFSEQFEQAALENLERQLSDLLTRQREATGETVESVSNQLQDAQNKVEATTTSIKHFSRLTVTALRQHFTDDEISRLFGVFNPSLLGLAIGRTGVTLSDAKEVVRRLRRIIDRIVDGVYQDDSTTVRFGPPADLLSKFQNVEALERELEKESGNVSRLGALLEAVTQRDELSRRIGESKTQKQAQADKLAAYRGFKENLAKEPEWRSAVAILRVAITAAEDEITKFEATLEDQGKVIADLGAQKTDADKQYKQVLQRYDECRMALFNVAPRADTEIPDDFDSAVSFYEREHRKESDLTTQLEKGFGKLGVFADRFKSNDEAETVRNLEQELDALPDREKASQLRWKSHIHGLKSRFQEVLNDLRLVESAKDKLNKEFSRVQVSDLKALKLIVERQADEVSLLERLASLDELNLMEDTAPLDKVLERVRSKMSRNPVTRIAELFTLGVVVTTADGKTKRYADFHQVESDGTTVTIKVLFNLLVLKSLLHKEDVAIPFFLDEVERLDPANQRAIIQTAKKLGFIAITAAPSAIGEVDVCYFLEADERGRVVLTEGQRLGIESKVQSAAE